MGLLKNAIMTALREQGIEAEWVGEKPAYRNKGK